MKTQRFAYREDLLNGRGRPVRCCKCLNTGTTEYDELCDCPYGDEKREAAFEALSEVLPACHKCSDSGVQAGDEPCDCEAGRELAELDATEAEAREDLEDHADQCRYAGAW